MKFLFMISNVLILTLLPLLKVQGEFPILSHNCREKIENRDSQFNQEVIKDIIQSFHLESFIQNSYHVTLRDLEMAHQLYGNKEHDSYYHSLSKHFLVSSKGGPMLYLNGTSAVLVYKALTDKNVMIELMLIEEKWIEHDRKEIQGEEIPFKVLKCEKEYTKKKLEYDNKSE